MSWIACQRWKGGSRPTEKEGQGRSSDVRRIAIATLETSAFCRTASELRCGTEVRQPDHRLVRTSRVGSSFRGALIRALPRANQVCRPAHHVSDDGVAASGDQRSGSRWRTGRLGLTCGMVVTKPGSPRPLEEPGDEEAAETRKASVRARLSIPSCR